MKAKVKTKPTISEATIQKQLVSSITKAYGKDTRMFVNPMSGASLPRDWDEQRRSRFFTWAKSLGWQKDAPDLVIKWARAGFTELVIELKRPGENPLRESKGGIWYNQTVQKKRRDIEQARYMADLVEEGAFATFCDTFSQAWDLVQRYNKGQLPPYEMFEVSGCRYTGQKKCIMRLI